jgi:hypothetical protein
MKVKVLQFIARVLIINKIETSASCEYLIEVEYSFLCTIPAAYTGSSKKMSMISNKRGGV